MARGKGKARAKANKAAPPDPFAGVSSSGGIEAGTSEIEAVASSSLEQLKTRYPEQWDQTGRAMVAALESGHAAGAAKFLARMRAEAAPWRQRVRNSGGNLRVIQAALPALVRERMSQLAVREVVENATALRGKGGAAASGKTALAARPVQVRFGRWSGTLIQKLFFRRGLERKPVSMGWFRLLWPLVTEKTLLLPLCEPKGIYCFYSRPLIEGLAALIRETGPGPALEIAAGDGTLSRFLSAAGTSIRASDDQSWSHAIAFPADVEALDAAQALARHTPRVVICSWPPPGNRFEKRVFSAPSVDRYIVITTRHRFAAGDWAAYDDAQAVFDRRVDERLSALVLPPEIDPVVLVFDRRY
jgi:hypothetical protein